MIFTKLLSGIILMKKLCGTDCQKWFTITPPSARMIGKKFIEYRRTPEFKRLSEQGSEIRKKSKYGSTGGRDGYRKREQDRFEKTGKWAERHDRWLNIHVKPDGEFKNEAFKIITDTIELCAKHGINRETMAEETTAPTVDQHNSFKASCTLNEKEVGSAYMDCVPTDTVHGIPLGEENVRVTITVPKIKRILLPIPMNEATCIEEAVGGFVAWPKRLVVVQTSLSQASQGPSHAPNREAKGSKRTKKRARRKKIQSQPEVQQQPAQQELPSFDFGEIPLELRPLAYYAQNLMRDGTQIMCPLQQFVIGNDMPIYIGFEDVYHFISFKEISANNIMVYIRYLADCCARTSMDQRFKFISPVLVSPVQQNIDHAAYEGYVECGYFVLAFMREITFTVDGLSVLQANDFYTYADMSLVRQECATFVMRFPERGARAQPASARCATTTVSLGNRRGSASFPERGARPASALASESKERREILGYEIPSKARMVVNAWALGRDSEVWENAQSFQPERFIGSLVDLRGTNFEFLPFGAGRRMCPGITFAFANVELVLAQLLSHFD
ncbi:hypothetical protein TIFTF001_001744 [Ficus carica]|uniref:DUF8039 domain-containing protein n=1 Tax=Ficus carica TaxID=3494 RepID=A0AA87Z305_FICCA|nr:hypothetical protein TIFTF001_001744 [Ficus carica]